MINKPVYDELMQKYRKHFGRDPEVVAYAPGRIEVLGNHTDYNEGFVFSAAINFGTFFAVSMSASKQCRLVAGDLMKEVTFEANDVTPSKTDTWQNYVKGTFAGLTKQSATVGFDGMFFGNIPLIKKNFSATIFIIIFVSILPGIIEIWRHKTKK